MRVAVCATTVTVFVLAACASTDLPSIANPTGPAVVVTDSKGPASTTGTSTGALGGTVTTTAGGTTTAGKGSTTAGGRTSGTTGGGTVSGGTGSTGTTGGGASTGTTTGPVLISNFNNQSGVATGWGTFSGYGGGTNNNESQSLVFNASGVNGAGSGDYCAELSYQNDTGALSYSQIILLFNQGNVAQDFNSLRFQMTGTGSDPAYIYVVTRLSNASNSYATYGAFLNGPAPNTWVTFTVNYKLFTETSGTPDFTLEQALDPNNFQGWKWDVSNTSSSAAGAQGTLYLDNVYMQP